MPSSTSTQQALTVRIPERFLEKAAATICSHYWREYQQEFTAEHVSLALIRWLDQHVDLVLEEITELLTRPGSDEGLEFGRMLERVDAPALDVAVATVQVAVEDLHPMFSGNRPLSADRLAAMMGYFAGKGIELYKTKLNKLLFYADLTGFYLTGRGLSGVQYVNLPYGPVPDRFEDMIDHAVGAGVVETVAIQHTDPAVRLVKPGTEKLDVLDDKDRLILDWVVENYGMLSTSAITDLSHEEKAYTDTRRGERIAYAYAQFLKKLPPKDLLES